MTSVTLTDEQLDRLANALADRVADRLVEHVAAATRVVAGRLVSAAELAEVLGVIRETVYEHAAELGGVRLGNGPRSRWRFDVDHALERWSSRVPSSGSQPPDAAAVTGRTPHRRQREPGSQSPLLPIKGRKDAA